MRQQEALIAWTPGTDRIEVGPLLRKGDADWTLPYRYTGGAAYVALRKCENELERIMMMFIDFNTIVVRDRVPADAVHREFLKIDEYRRRIAPDTPGAEGSGGLGGW